jgi:outer membrane protein OmpA-like peptidoglycan-associated protein
MKIIIIGFLVFLGWTSLSTYVYVCKIKGLCHEAEPVVTKPPIHAEVVMADTVSKALIQKKVVIPKDLLIYFSFDKSELASSTELSKYFEESMAYMFVNTGATLRITGHTDAVGSEEYNQALGYRRAQSIQSFFENKGMPPVKIVIGSKGEKEPADDNSTVSGRTKNRRAVLIINP